MALARQSNNVVLGAFEMQGLENALRRAMESAEGEREKAAYYGALACADILLTYKLETQADFMRIFEKFISSASAV